MPENKNWTLDDVLAVYNMPLLELVYRAASVHRAHHNPREVQISTLLSIKTGGCPEDCGYCPQAARYHTAIEGNDLMSVQQVKAQALRAKASGSSRVCMGAAWRSPKTTTAAKRAVAAMIAPKMMGDTARGSILNTQSGRCIAGMVRFIMCRRSAGIAG